MEKELLKDEKELAEHNMLVDLGRNDIGKISKIGSVNVEKYKFVEKYSHIMHIASTVSGIIRDDKLRENILNKAIKKIEEIGFKEIKKTISPIKGTKGNIEYLAYFIRNN